MQNNYENVFGINIPIVNEHRKYWFVRTYGGEYYDTFRKNSFIGIGWNQIDNEKMIFNEKLKDKVIETIKKAYPEEKRPGYVLTQIKLFLKEMSKGDVVLIPSEDSDNISIGEIIEDNYYIEEKLDISENGILLNNFTEEVRPCPYSKRRKIQWIKTIRKSQIDPKLYKIIYTHQTVIDLSEDYRDIIDRIIYTYYIRDRIAYYTINVNKKEKIPAFYYAKLLNNTLELVSEFDKTNGSEYCKNEIAIKTNVQSEGMIQFVGGIKVITIIAFILFNITGGKISFMGLTIESPGLSKTIIEFIEGINRIRKENLEINQMKKNILCETEKSVKELKVTVPQISDMINISESATDKKEKD